jgi:hypothetical protein
MSSSSSTSALAAALGSPPTQQLTRGNFLIWKALVTPAFRGANVMGMIDGSDHAPPPTLESEDANKQLVISQNPAYAAWMARDQHVLRWLLNSISPEILSHLLDVTSTVEAWSTVNSMFASASRSKVQHLRTKLQETKKLQMSADEYFTKMKS